MVKIPTYERQVRPNATPIPMSTGEGYEAPGRALAYQAKRMMDDAQHVKQIGGMVQSVLGALGSLAGKAEADRNALDMYQTKVALADFQGQQDMAQIDYDAQISGDGRDHAAGRLQSYDAAANDLMGRLPANDKARILASERVAGLRSHYGEKSYIQQQKHLQGYYDAETTRLVQERVLPNITSDLTSVEGGLKGIDNILADMPGATEKTRSRIRDQALDIVYRHWTDKAGANAAAIGAKIVEEFRSRPEAPKSATVADARALSALVPIHKGLTRGDPDRNIDGLTKPMVSSLAKMLNDMPPEIRKHLEINEAHRSTAYQARLREAYESGRGGLAAPAGRSRHNFGEAVDFSPPGGYGSNYDRKGYNQALAWMYANSEKYGLVNPESIRGRDPHHFQLAPGVKDGGPVEVAARGLTTYAGNRTLYDEFKGRIVENYPALEKFSLGRERAERAAEAAALKAQHQAIEGQALDLWNKQELTKDWVERNGSLMDPKAYGRWLRMFDNVPRVTDPQVYSGLAEKAHADPEQAVKDAADAYANRQLDADGYRSVLKKAQRALEPTTRMPQWARETRNAVSKMLKPDGKAGDGEHAAYKDALEKFDAYVEEQGEALDRKGLTGFADDLVKGHKMDGARESRKGLPMPRFGSVGRDVMSLEALEIAKQRTVEAFKAGKIDKETLSREAGLLKKWQGALEAQAAAEGKPVKPSAPAAQGAKPAGEAGKQTRPALKIEMNPQQEQATP
ncbi:MAG: M15 family metallopeptidase [Pseudomonadota bacterium]